MKKILSAFLLGATLISAGCEKEKVFFEDQLTDSKSGAGFGLPNNEPLALTVEASSTTISEAINAFLSGNNKGNATVTVAVDESLVDAYNSANGTEYMVMPSDVYTIPSSITITGGSGSADVSFDIQKLLESGTSAAIGFKITAVSGATDYVMPGNSQIVVTIKVKNPFEGDYASKGYFFHPSSPRAIARDKFIATIDPNTSETELGDLASLGYYFDFDTDGSTVSGWVAAGACPAAPASGFMTEDNPAGISTYPGPGGFTSDIYNNTYDAANGIYWLHYGYQSGSAGQAAYQRQVYEKLTLK